jgi:hypothetical protein
VDALDQLVLAEELLGGLGAAAGAALGSDEDAPESSSRMEELRATGSNAAFDDERF